MRIVFKIVHIIIGILLVISTAFQLLAMLGGVVFNANNDLAALMPWLVPVWCGMLVLLIAAFVLLLKLGARYPWQPIILIGALAAAVAAFIVAITLRDTLPDHLNVSGETQGLTTWRMLYRHLSSSLVGVLIAVEAGIKWILCLRERKKAQAAANDPAASTIGLDSFAGDESAYTKPKKLKRSLRRAKEKTGDKPPVE